MKIAAIVALVAVFGPHPERRQAQEVRLPRLAAELARRVKIDQDIRGRLTELMRQGQGEAALQPIFAVMADTDRENTAWLSRYVRAFGWPRISDVGREGANHAWLLVQHSPDRRFMREALDLMTPLLAQKEVDPTNYAYLLDRVRLGEGKKQVYGTQVESDGQGGWRVQPTERPQQLDERRRSVGLPPIAAYMRQIEAVYGKSPQARPDEKKSPPL